ncbi:MAG: cohesin domain-containing protein [Candidatus Uhrbacteria bacterium]
MKTLAAILLGLMTLGGLSVSSVAHASGDALLWFSPQTYTVQTGSTVDVVLKVNPNGESIDTVRANLSFPPAFLEVVSFTLGSQFPYATPGNAWSNSAGTLSEGAYVYGSPVLTEGTFGTITFRALSSGTATVSIDDDSRLIYEGDEKINLSSLGSATVTVGGTAVAPTQSVVPSTSASLEQQALVYFGAFSGRMPSNGVDWEALHCIAYDTCSPTVQIVAHEQQALVAFGEKYARMPSSQLDWNTLHALAYTNVFYNWDVIDGTAVVAEEESVVEEVAAEEPVAAVSNDQLALGYFGTLTGRMPSNGDDWTAAHCIADNSCYPGASGADASKEAQALSVFTTKYGRLPSSNMDWNAVHAVAYTNMVIDWEAEVVADEPAEEESSELSTQQQALGYFGTFTGRLPASGDDWTAVNCIADNSCYPGASGQDATKEGLALSAFTEKYSRLPASDMDWNAVHALAYTNMYFTW